MGGRPVVRATAWRIGVPPSPPSVPAGPSTVPARPAAQPQSYFPGLDDWGYGRAIEWRFVSGGYTRPGPTQVWARPRIPLVAGEGMSPLARVLVVADSANGLSADHLPLAQWLFIPPALTVTLNRLPSGDWVFLDARSSRSPDGIGLATADLGDDDGLLGVAAQPLLIAARG